MAKKSKIKEVAIEDRITQVGARIVALRKAQGVSQEALAYSNGIDRSQMGRQERGADMKLSSLFKILAALGTTPAEFFAEGFD